MSGLVTRNISEKSINTATEQAYRDLRGSYGLTLDREEANSLVTRHFALYHLLRPHFAEAVQGTGSGLERCVAADAYALGLSSKVLLHDTKENVPKNGYAPNLRIREPNPRTREHLILSPVLRQYMQHHDTQAPRYHLTGAQQYIRAFLDSSEQTIATLPPDVVAAARRQPVTVAGTTYRGLNETQPLLNAPSDERIEEQIVGNEELMTGLQRILHKTLHYDPVRKQNPFVEAGIHIPRTVLISGPPGSGKSLGVNRLFQEAERFSQERGLAPVYLHRIGNHLKTGVINEGIQNLNAIRAETQRVDGVHLTLIDDADMVVFSRNALSHHPEEQKFLHAMMEWLENGKENRRGNEVVVAISNYIGNMDPAFLSRLRERSFTAFGPQTPEEYTTLYQSKLAPFAASGRLDPAICTVAGALSAKEELSGRDVKNICLSLTEEAYASAFDTGRAYDAEGIKDALSDRKPLDEETLQRSIASYVEFKQQETARAKEELVESRYKDALLNYEVRTRLQERFPDTATF